MIVLPAMLFHHLLHFPELVHGGPSIVVFPNIIYASNDNNFQPVAVLQHILDQGSGEIFHPCPDNAFKLQMLRFFRHDGVVPYSVQSAICEDKLFGGVTGLDGGLKLLTHRAHEVPLGPLASKSSLLHGGEVVVPDHG